MQWALTAKHAKHANSLQSGAAASFTRQMNVVIQSLGSFFASFASFAVATSRVARNTLRKALRPQLTLTAILCVAGCASPRHETALHPFDFYTDTFSYSNQLVWQYEFDPHTGQVTT